MKKLSLFVIVAALLALAACKAGKPGDLETSVVRSIRFFLV